MKQQIVIPNRPGAEAFLGSFHSATRKKGKQYFFQGAVSNLKCEVASQLFSANVQGSELYYTTLLYENGHWEAECTCPLVEGCKHAYAVMMALLNGQTILTKPTTFRAAPPTPAPEPIQPENPLSTRVAEAVQRKLRPEEHRYIKQVYDLFHRCRVARMLTSWDLRELAPGIFGYGWESLNLWPAFPKDEVQFWNYLAYAFRERNISFPKCMAAITDFERMAKAMAEWKRRQEIDLWKQQLANAGLQRLPVERGAMDLRMLVTPQLARVEWKPVGDAKFQPMKQTHFKRLADEYANGTLEIVSEAQMLWNCIYRPWDYNRHIDLHLHTPECKRALNQLLRLPAMQDRMLTETGAPFARPAESLRWSMQPAESKDDDYRLRLVLPDGSSPPPLLVILTGRPTLYVCSTAIYSGPPPSEHALDVTKTNAIPAPALESKEGLDFLVRLGLDLPPRIQERTQRVRLQVKVFCDLKRPYIGSDTESVFIRVIAEAEAGQRRETFMPNGWEGEAELLTAKRKQKDDTLYVFDRQGMELFPSLLETLGVTWDVYLSNWRLRLSKNFPEKFVPWLASLPKHIEVHLDADLATLTKDPVAASVKLDCTEAGVDWFDLKVVLDVSDTELTPEELKILLDARGRYVRLGKKGWRRLQFNLTEEEDQRLAHLGLSARDFTSEPQRLHALQLADDAACRLLPEEQVAQIHRRVGELKTRVAPPVPANISAQLRPYQVEGFHFLAYLTENRFGGILADDMGLGKTLQTLTWLAWLRSRPDVAKKPSLVVCPKSVMDNWQAEAEKFMPGLRVKIWRGTDIAALPDMLGEADLLVINYSQLRAMDTGLAAVNWHAAILDEGQYIKNPQSQTASAARALKADHRLTLSGTPIENKLLDLWSLMAFAMPGVLGNRTHFAKRFDHAEDPLARRRLAARVRPFLLRRTKGQVASELPDRIEEDLFCELEGEQKTLYRAEFKRAQQMLLKIQTRQELNEQRFNFLTSLLRLRQICCHPALLSEEYKNAESAKLNALLELLEPLMDEGNKVLVFSQFVTMLDILRTEVKEKGWQHFYLAGATENRGELVADFQKADGAAVFLISLKAGGFGLNLTAASYVVLFDPWWNPAVENQAIDRTHRIGQTSKVIAYRLLIKNSIEEKIRALQRTKKALAEDVLGEDSFAKSLTLDDLKFLFADDGQ